MAISPAIGETVINDRGYSCLFQTDRGRRGHSCRTCLTKELCTFCTNVPLVLPDLQRRSPKDVSYWKYFRKIKLIFLRSIRGFRVSGLVQRLGEGIPSFHCIYSSRHQIFSSILATASFFARSSFRNMSIGGLPASLNSRTYAAIVP